MEVVDDLETWKWIAFKFFNKLGGTLLHNAATEEYAAAIPDKNGRRLLLKDKHPMNLLGQVGMVIDNLEQVIDSTIEKHPEKLFNPKDKSELAEIIRTMDKTPAPVDAEPKA